MTSKWQLPTLPWRGRVAAERSEAAGWGDAVSPPPGSPLARLADLPLEGGGIATTVKPRPISARWTNKTSSDLLAHAVLILGAALMTFPIYMAFVASTHTLTQTLTGLPLLPQDRGLHPVGVRGRVFSLSVPDAGVLDHFRHPDAAGRGAYPAHLRGRGKSRPVELLYRTYRAADRQRHRDVPVPPGVHDDPE